MHYLQDSIVSETHVKPCIIITPLALVNSYLHELNSRYSGSQRDPGVDQRKDWREAMSLPDRIRLAREAASLTQVEMARRLGKRDVSSIRNYEKGRNEPPIAVLRRIAKIGGFPLAWFFAEDVDGPRPSVSSYDPDEASIPPGLQRLIDLGCAMRPDEIEALKGYADPTDPARGARGAMGWSPGEWLDALLDERREG